MASRKTAVWVCEMMDDRVTGAVLKLVLLAQNLTLYFDASSDYKYSRLSLSRLCLFRTTAYLEVKTWPMFKHESLTTGNKILSKRGEIAPKEQFLLFATIFSIYLKLQESNYIFICEMLLSRVILSFLNSANLICRATGISNYFRVPWTSR